MTPIPTMLSIDSGGIAAIGYHHTDEQIYVRYSSGRLVRYTSVPSATWDGLRQAKDKAHFIAHHIRPRFFAFTVHEETV